MTYSKDNKKKDDKKKEGKTVPKKVYMIIDNKKHYIDPEIVKKYDLEKVKVSFFTGRKLYIEKD